MLESGLQSNLKKILIVEDEVIIAMAEKISLEQVGYTVLIANSGEKAIQLLNDSSDIVDLILMDIDLGSGIDGTQTASAILLKHDIPIVFLSSHTENHIVEKTRNITSFGYVTKSSSITVLDASIRMAFQLHDAFRKLRITGNELRESEERMRTLITSMPDIVCIKDAQGRWIVANDFDLEVFQIKNVDYIGKKDSELAQYSPFYREAFLSCESTDEQTWLAGVPTRGIEVIPRPDGNNMTFDVIKVPTFHNDGSRKSLIVVGRDITELHKTLEKLEKTKSPTSSS